MMTSILPTSFWGLRAPDRWRDHAPNFILTASITVKLLAFALVIQLSQRAVFAFAAYASLRSIGIALLIVLAITLLNRLPWQAGRWLALLGSLSSGIAMIGYAAFIRELHDYPLPGALAARAEGLDFIARAPSIIFQGLWPLFFIDTAVVVWLMLRRIPISRCGKNTVFLALGSLLTVEAVNIATQCSLLNGSIHNRSREVHVRRYGATSLWITELLRQGLAPDAVLGPSRLRQPIELFQREHDAKPNILVIQVESLDWFCLSRSIADIPVMPFLSRVRSQGLIVPMVASHWTGGSADCEFAVMTGCRPPINVPWWKSPWPEVPALPAELVRNGYQTAASHNNSGSYFNRRKRHQEFGAQTFFDYHDLGLPESS